MILGATGTVGRGIVAAAVEAGRPVIAVARNADALAALHARHADAGIVTLPASVASDADAAALARRLRDLRRPIAGVVAAICGDSARGRLLDQPAEFLRRRFDEDLLPHLFAARHLLPLLAETAHAQQAHACSGYVLIGGPGAEQPWAGYGHRSIGAAALRMLARVLHDEARAFPVRVQLLAVDSPVRTDANAHHACDGWPDTRAVARRALAMVDDAMPCAHVVVRYSARHAPVSPCSDDIDTEAIAAPWPAASQTADNAVPALPAHCLQDARVLLRAVLQPNPNANQETSPR